VQAEFANTVGNSQQRAWVTVVLASLGGAFEFYDFIIYGVFAREIGFQFFPANDPIINMMSTFSVFALGYLVRPVGGAILGGLGDRYGRKFVFIFSILATSIATVGIGLVPPYAAIGFAAPAVLLLFRMAQGMFFAGELPCSITYVVEEMPKRAGLVAGAVISVTILGVLIATLVSLFIRVALPADAVRDYGWRIAFIGGGALGFLSYWFRSSLEESAGFRQMKSQIPRNPFRETISLHWKPILIGIGIASILNTSNITLFVVVPSYFTSVLGYDAKVVSVAQNIGILTAAVVIFFTGWLSDKIPARYLHRFGAAMTLCFAYPLYHLIVGRAIDPILAFVGFGTLVGIFGGTYAYLLADLFPTRIRFTGVALALNLSTVIFTALIPLVTTMVLNATGIKEAPGLVMAMVACVALVAGLFLKRASGNIGASAQKLNASSKDAPDSDRYKYEISQDSFQSEA
jgi:MFS family permease